MDIHPPQFSAPLYRAIIQSVNISTQQVSEIQATLQQTET